MITRTIGHLFGASLITALVVVMPIRAHAASTLTTLWNFMGGNVQPLDGSQPYASLISDSTGAVYGTTVVGGTAYCGTVFKLSPPNTVGGPWAEKVLYSFMCLSDGRYPEASLIFGKDGALYGTTSEGGSSDYGTVFKLAPPSTTGGPWNKTILYSFSGGDDGANPGAGLIFDTSGVLYGTTVGGGAHGAGTVYKLTPDSTSPTGWTETVLYSFCSQTNCSDGGNPYAGLIFGTGGALYGTASGDGSANDGTVFKLTPPATVGGAWNESVLHSFSGSDGAHPYDGLISDSTGALYGTTVNGGNTSCESGCGTVFKLTPPSTVGGTWNESVLYSFAGGSGGSDGGHPLAGLILDALGALYGTTPSGGTSTICSGVYIGCGTVFKLTPSSTAGGAWTESVLYSFTGGSDGGMPYAGLISDASGALYGTAYAGGSTGDGTVFEITGSGFTVFAGLQGQPDCIGKTISPLAQKYGGLDAAAAALGYSSVSALQSAVAGYCGG
jgi:uncharacterized repeat protein (TIGR03803 family)